MRKTILGAAVFALLALAPFALKPAQAMTLPAPSGLASALGEVSIAEDVACRRVWRCGRYGCGWRRVCWGPPRGFYRPYGYRSHRYGYGHRRWHRGWHRW
jgi:hypothetical protein